MALRFYLTTNGRISRKANWLAVILPLVLVTAATGIADSLFFSKSELIFLGQVYSPISAVVTALVAWPSIATSIRRFHDLNMTGWWAALMIPLYWLPDFTAYFNKSLVEQAVIIGWAICAFVCVLLGLAQLFVRGTIGPNRFGHDPIESN